MGECFIRRVKSSIFQGDDLVAWYPLQGDTKDYSNFSNDGTNNGAIASALGYLFDGADDYIRVIGDNLNGGSWGYPLASFSFWVYPESSADTSSMQYDNIITIEYAFEIAIHNLGDGTSSLLYASNPWSWRNTGLVSNDQWSHVMYTHEETNRKVYVNGNLLYTSNDTGFLLPGTSGASYPWMTLGGRMNGPQYNLDGSLSDVRIYNRTLSGEEVLTLYNITRHKYNK